MKNMSMKYGIIANPDIPDTGFAIIPYFMDIFFI
jgi:hypothetical protein